MLKYIISSRRNCASLINAWVLIVTNIWLALSLLVPPRPKQNIYREIERLRNCSIVALATVVMPWTIGISRLKSITRCTWTSDEWWESTNIVTNAAKNCSRCVFSSFLIFASLFFLFSYFFYSLFFYYYFFTFLLFSYFIFAFVLLPIVSFLFFCSSISVFSLFYFLLLFRFFKLHKNYFIIYFIFSISFPSLSHFFLFAFISFLLLFRLFLLIK